MTRIFAIIPARAGSVGVPDKNVALIRGVTLLQRAYRVSRALPFDVETIVSTDSMRYLELLAQEGHADLTLRPAELSSSKALVIDTVIHELARLDAKDDDLVLLLEPSFVGRRSSNVISAVHDTASNQVDSCFGAYRVPSAFHHEKQYVQEGVHARPVSNRANINRQELPAAFVRSGEFYLSRVGLVRKERSLFGGRLALFETSRPFVNIDHPDDLAVARQIPEECLD